MKQSEKLGVVGGTIGATIGCTLWLIIIGVRMQSPLIIATPIIWGLICIIGTIKLYSINPAKRFTILGLAVLWLIILNLILGNLLYEQIPDTLQGIATGIESISRVKLNIFLGIVAIFGFILIIRDNLK